MRGCRAEESPGAKLTLPESPSLSLAWSVLIQVPCRRDAPLSQALRKSLPLPVSGLHVGLCVSACQLARALCSVDQEQGRSGGGTGNLCVAWETAGPLACAVHVAGLSQSCWSPGTSGDVTGSSPSPRGGEGTSGGWSRVRGFMCPSGIPSWPLPLPEMTLGYASIGRCSHPGMPALMWLEGLIVCLQGLPSGQGWGAS